MEPLPPEGREDFTLKFPANLDPKMVLTLLDKMKLAVENACNQTWRPNL
jgi:hypothetical protein